MNTPPTDKECEVILQWMHTYYSGVIDDYERYFIQENYYRDEFDGAEREAVQNIVDRYLDPMPESLEKLLEGAK